MYLFIVISMSTTSIYIYIYIYIYMILDKKHIEKTEPFFIIATKFNETLMA